MRQGALVTQDGQVFPGEVFGRVAETSGEVVFNTAMTGYQEILTDPSYAGQIVVMTYPEIGNCGVNSEDEESDKPVLAGFVVRELSPLLGHFRSHESLEDYFKRHGLVGLSGVDTRAVVRHVRTQGAMPALIVVAAQDPAGAIQRAAALPGMAGQDWVQHVTCHAPYVWREGTWRLGEGFASGGPARFKVVAYDFGIKRNILRQLVAAGCAVTIVPAKTDAQEVLGLQPDGVFLSNGPGDPAVVDYAIRNIQALVGKTVIFGICLGHQLLGLALGGRTYKLKFGHHGANQPVQDLATGQVEITAQNHGFAVAGDSLPQGLEVTHINLNDQTVAGMAHGSLPIFSVQYHPEASPGPHDSHYLFRRFVEMMSHAQRS